MRILIDARYLDGTFSGIGTYSRHLLENLSDVDPHNEYVVLVRPGFDGRLSVGDNFSLLSYSPKPVSFSTISALGSSVDGLRVDLMHSLFPMAPLRMRTPLLVTVHDLQPFVDPEFSGRRLMLLQAAYSLFYRYIYPATLKKSKWVINVSHHTRDTVAEHFPELVPKLMVVTSGIDESIFSPPARDPAEVLRRHELEEPYLLYYGSTRPNKNLPNMLRAFSKYIAEREDGGALKFVLIVKRDRFFRDARRVIRQEGLKQRVRVIDQVSGEDQRAILAKARALMFATKFEGFGFPALEAMASGVPVLAGDSGALPETCGRAAEYADPDDVYDIAQGLDRILNDKQRRDELIALGNQQARGFNWRTSAEYVHDIYRLLF